MDITKLKGLVTQVKVELPKLERKAAEPREVRTRDLKTEVEVDTLTGELFRGLAEQQMLQRKLTGVKNPGAEVRMQVETLKQAIVETKGAIRADIGLYSRWIAGPLSVEDELMVSLDLAERRVLRELGLEEAEQVKAAWREYHQRREMGKDEDEESDGDRRPQKLFTVREITGANSSRSRYFVKQTIPKGEQFPDGYSQLMGAYAAHFKQKQAHYRDLGRLAGEMVKELGVDETKTLADVAAATTANVVAFEVMASHEWKSQDGRSLTGKVVVKNDPAVDGVAKLEILGAVGSIFSSLRRHIAIDGNPGTVFAFKAGRAFEGVSKADTGDDQPWLRALLARVLPNGSPRRSAPLHPSQFTPQTPRGHRGDEDQGPRRGKGRREKMERGGGKSRTHYTDRRGGEE